MTTATLSRADAVKHVRFVVDDTGNARPIGSDPHAIVRESAPDGSTFRHSSKLVGWTWGNRTPFMFVAVHSYLDVELTGLEAVELATDYINERFAIGGIDVSAPDFILCPPPASPLPSFTHYRNTTMTAKPDIYSRVTDRIVSQLESGVLPWTRPWNADHAAGRITRPLRHNGQPYRGINVLVLWDAAESAGYSCPLWLTYNQAAELGGNVRKGEKSTPVVYSSTFVKEREDGGTDKIPFLKQYSVFNAEQCENLPERFSETAEPPTEGIELIERAERFFAATGATVEHGGSKAFYRISDDVIRLPRLETFVNAESYHATQAHEFIHWTRHETRLDRSFGRKRFGDCGYAMEELVAELGSAFLCADLELTLEVRDEHAEYLACWIQVLKDDKRAIFTAASYAGNAVEFLHGLQPEPAEVTEPADCVST